jgi:hypothetical protein
VTWYRSVGQHDLDRIAEAIYCAFVLDREPTVSGSLDARSGGPDPGGLSSDVKDVS